HARDGDRAALGRAPQLVLDSPGQEHRHESGDRDDQQAEQDDHPDPERTRYADHGESWPMRFAILSSPASNWTPSARAASRLIAMTSRRSSGTSPTENPASTSDSRVVNVIALCARAASRIAVRPRW